MIETKPHSLDVYDVLCVVVCCATFEKSNKFKSTEKGENSTLAFYNLFAFVRLLLLLSSDISVHSCWNWTAERAYTSNENKVATPLVIIGANEIRYNVACEPEHIPYASSLWWPQPKFSGDFVKMNNIQNEIKRKDWCRMLRKREM